MQGETLHLYSSPHTVEVFMDIKVLQGQLKLWEGERYLVVCRIVINRTQTRRNTTVAAFLVNVQP